MALTSKIRVGVLRGGPSKEHDVSIKTGANVLKNLPENYSPIDIYIDKEGIWHVQGIAEDPSKVVRKIDIFFNALHGEYGEDGGLQHTLDLFGIPYTGSGRMASVFAMHKGHAKKFLDNHGIKSPYHRIYKKTDANLPTIAQLWKIIPNPSIVKPISGGSSIGVSLVQNPQELAEALDLAFSLSNEIIIEEYISGKEATCGVIDHYRSKSIYPLFPSEPVPLKNSRFFDHDSKFINKSRSIHPGRFSAMEKEAIQNAATTIHKVMGLRHYSRSDFIVNPKRGIYFLEVNSLPGLYINAPFTEALTAVGQTFSGFLDHVITLALKGK
ncbi:MAG: ATP-grasp domain-containing protein [Candidatus Taylorbacteria bacterium]|nr:ATP-grasp domain-containing protein [Candidatus Taylorbacteria bacterium]